MSYYCLSFLVMSASGVEQNRKNKRCHKQKMIGILSSRQNKKKKKKTRAIQFFVF